MLKFGGVYIYIYHFISILSLCQEGRTKPWDSGEDVIKWKPRIQVDMQPRTYMPTLLRRGWVFWSRFKLLNRETMGRTASDSDASFRDCSYRCWNGNNPLLCMVFCFKQKKPWYKKKLCKSFHQESRPDLWFTKRPQVLGILVQLIHCNHPWLLFSKVWWIWGWPPETQDPIEKPCDWMI